MYALNKNHRPKSYDIPNRRDSPVSTITLEARILSAMKNGRKNNNKEYLFYNFSFFINPKDFNAKQTSKNPFLDAIVNIQNKKSGVPNSYICNNNKNNNVQKKDIFLAHFAIFTERALFANSYILAGTSIASRYIAFFNVLPTSSDNFRRKF